MTRPRWPPTFPLTFELLDLTGRKSWAFSKTFRLNKPLLPAGVGRPESFAGYPTVFHALAAATGTPNTALIYHESINRRIHRQGSPWWFGSFVTFDTGSAPMKPIRSGVIAPRELPRHVVNVRFANLWRRQDSRSFAERRQEIEDIVTDDGVIAAYAACASLLQDYSFLDAQEVNADAGIESLALTPDQRNAHLRPNVVNVDYTGEEAAKNGTHAYTVWSPTSDICEPASTEVPVPSIAVTNVGLLVPHPVFTLATLAHEATHALHKYRALLLLERWRTLPIRRRPPFHLWVMQLSRNSTDVTDFDFLLALALCNRMNGSQLVHFDAHVEGWILVMSFAPLDELQPNVKTYRFPAVKDFVTIQKKYYDGGLRYLSYAQAHVAPRIRTTFAGLAAERQQVVLDSLALVEKAIPRADSYPFFSWLRRVFGSRP